MQTLRKRRALILVFSALLVTVCRCQPNVFGNNVEITRFSDGTVAMSCELFTEVFETKEATNGTDSRGVWECSVACPDGSDAKFDTYEQPAQLVNARTEEEKTAFKAQYCSAETAASTETLSAPIEAPSETPTATEPPTATQEESIVIATQDLLILQPILAGSVTACDTGLGFINFSLADSLPDLTGKSVSVLINGNKVNCALAGSNSQLLGCSLPAGTVFPLNVSTTLDGVAVDNFSFNGAICTRTSATKEVDENPEQPTQPPVDCDVNPDPYQC